MAVNKVNKKKSFDPGRMAITRKGLWLMVAGVAVMVLGFILLSGGGSKDPQVFNYAMFDFRRMVGAPLVIIAGIVVEVVAIMGLPRSKKDKK